MEEFRTHTRLAHLGSSNAEFLNVVTFDILDWIFLCYGDCPGHCRMFNSIPSKCLVGRSPIVTDKNVS